MSNFFVIGDKSQQVWIMIRYYTVYCLYMFSIYSHLLRQKRALLHSAVWKAGHRGYAITSWYTQTKITYNTIISIYQTTWLTISITHISVDKFCSFGESFDRQVDLTTENFDKIQFMIRIVCVFTLTASVDDLKTTWLQQNVD